MVKKLSLFVSVILVFACSKNSSSPNIPPPVPPKPLPDITSFNPVSGAVDTIVTIIGSHFNPDISKDVVKFNGTKAVIKSGTETQLVVIVPFGASTGKISVSTDTSTAVSAQDFTILTGSKWTAMTAFPGTFMKNMTSFQVGNKLYIGMGQASQGNLPEFWQYDVLSGVWTRKADYPTTPIPGHGVGFTVGGKGYIIMSPDSSGYPAVWEYDTASDKWTAKGYSPQLVQTGMPAFTIDNYAYVGPCGDVSRGAGRFYQYNPVANSWTRKADFPGAGASYPAAFTIGPYGYVGTGITGFDGTTGSKEFYRYDPSSNTWTRKADFPGEGRNGAVGFTIGNYGYLGTGINSAGTYTQDFWQYNPSSDVWTQAKDFGGGIRVMARAFSGDKFGFAGYGQGPLHDGGVGGGYTDTWMDLWQYQP